MTQSFAVLFHTDNGSCLEDLQATNLEDAKKELELMVFDENKQEIDEENNVACWNTIISEGQEYDFVETASIVTLHGRDGEIDLDEWRDKIEDWEGETCRKLACRSKYKNEKEEFEAIQERYHELLERHDPSISSTVNSAKPVKKMRKKKCVRRKKQIA